MCSPSTSNDSLVVVGSYPLIGSPERIVDELIQMEAAGFIGTTLSFVNFADELPFFIERVLPLLEEAGLREARKEVS